MSKTNTSTGSKQAHPHSFLFHLPCSGKVRWNGANSVAALRDEWRKTAVVIGADALVRHDRDFSGGEGIRVLYGDE